MTGIRILLQQMVDVCIDRLVRALVAADICIRSKQIIKAVAGTRNMRVAVCAEIRLNDSRNRSVAGVGGIGVVVTRIAVLVRYVIVRVAVPCIKDIRAALNTCTVCACRHRRTVCQEQDVVSCISVGVDAGIGNIIVLIRRAVQNPVVPLAVNSISVVVVLRFERITALTVFFAAVIKQRELDALCNVVDRIEDVLSLIVVVSAAGMAVSGRSQQGCSQNIAGRLVVIDHIVVCRIVCDAHRIGDCIIECHTAAAEQCTVIHAARIAAGIMRVLRHSADELRFQTFVGMNVLRVVLKSAHKLFFPAFIGVDVFFEPAHRFVRQCQANAVQCPGDAGGHEQ